MKDGVPAPIFHDLTLYESYTSITFHKKTVISTIGRNLSISLI
jgi:hypothetical protein